MSKTYKCPICGETEHFPVESFSGSWHGGNRETSLFEGVGLEGHILANYSAYVCKNCGHVDFFAPSIAAKLSVAKSERDTRIRQAEEALERAKAERQNALAPLLEEEERLKKRLLEIAPLLSSDEITIKRHHELEEERVRIESRMREIAQKKVPFDRKVRDAEGELEKAKSSR